MNIQLIVFDVDGTLNDINQSPWRVITKKLGASVKQHIDIYNKFKQGVYPTQEAINRITRMWLETGNANKTNFQKILSQITLRPDAKSTIDYLKSKYQICLISGTLDMYIEIIKKELGIEYAYCLTKLYWDENRILKTFDYEGFNPFSKLNILDSFLKEKRITFEQCVAVGDGDNDNEIFKKVSKNFLLDGEYNHHITASNVTLIKELSELKKYL